MPAGAQKLRHRPPHCDLSPSTGTSWSVVFSPEIGGHLNTCWSLLNETTRDRSSSVRGTGEQGQRHLRQRTAPHLCERKAELCVPRGLVPLQEAAEKDNVAKKSTRAGVVCHVKLCGTQQGIAAMMMMHEPMLSDHLLPSRRRDRENWLLFVIERRYVVLSLHFIPIGSGHDENFMELTSPLTPAFCTDTPRSQQLHSQSQPLLFSKTGGSSENAPLVG